MEFISIPVVMLVLIVVYGLKNAYKKQDTPLGTDEHFPFPPIEKEDRDKRPAESDSMDILEEWKYYSHETLEGKSLEANSGNFVRGLAESTISVDEIDEEIFEEQDKVLYGQKEELDFDLRQAIIYSEILSAKYVKNSGSTV